MSRNNNNDLGFNHVQDNERGFPRRNFLKGILGATAATAVGAYVGSVFFSDMYGLIRGQKG